MPESRPRTRPSRRRGRLLAVGAMAAAAGLLTPVAPAYAVEGDQRVEIYGLYSGVKVGDTTSATVSVDNNSPGSARTLTVVVSVPAGLQVLAVAADAPMTCEGVRCTGTVASYGSGRIRLRLEAVAAGDQVLTASLEPRDTPDADPANDSASKTVAVAPGPDVQLGLQPLPSTIGYGDPVDLKGRLTRGDGSPVTDAYPTLQVRHVDGGDWATRGGASPAANGTYSLRVPTDADVDVRVVVGADDGRVISRVLPVRPVLRPQVALDPVRIPPGGTASAVLRVAGPVAGRTLTLQRLTADGWRTVATRSVTGPGSLGVPLGRFAAGNHRFRALLDGASTVPSAERVLPVSMKGYGDPRAYAFVASNQYGPARWNPCAPITYKVNARRAPRGGVADLAEAIRRVSLATGLTFRYGGTTTFVPGSRQRQTDQFVIAWATPSESPQLGGAAGVGGFSYTYTRSGRLQAYEGQVVLNATDQFLAGFGRGATEGALLMHELAHAVGAQHVNGAAQVMRPVMDNEADASMWGAGDLAGLYRLGKSQGCLS